MASKYDMVRLSHFPIGGYFRLPGVGWRFRLTYRDKYGVRYRREDGILISRSCNPYGFLVYPL